MVEISGVSACSGPPIELQNKRPDFDREPASVVPDISKKLHLPKPVEAEKDRSENPATRACSGPPIKMGIKGAETAEKLDHVSPKNLMEPSIQNPTDFAVLDPPASPIIPAKSGAQFKPGNNLEDRREVEKPTSPVRPENLKELSVKKPAVTVGHDQRKEPANPAKSVPQIDTGKIPPINPRTPSVPRNRPSTFSEPDPKFVLGARSDSRAPGVPKSRPDYRFSMQNPKFVPGGIKCDQKRGNIGQQPNPWMPVNQPFGRGDCTGFWRPEPMGMGIQNFRGNMQGTNGGRPSRPIPLMSVNFEPRKVQTVLVFLVKFFWKISVLLAADPRNFLTISGREKSDTAIV
jgi:hypothetical protein